MRNFLLALVLAVFGIFGISDTPAHARPLVVFTTFEPFGGWSVNLSHEIAEEVVRSGALENLGVDVRICRLPVVYDEASRQALSCLDGIGRRPDAVISLGEGSCDIRLETVAQNLDDTPGSPDNAGQTHVGQVIEAGAPERLGFTLPVDRFFCVIDPPARIGLNPSISAGNYVCNNNGYHLARHFAPLAVPYGHIHVPHSGCSDAVKDIKKNAVLIARMAYLALDRATEALPQPATRAEVEAALEAPGSSSCRRAFLERLLGQY
jgi:pyrrolidone-carboxylate peptidase